ncbi:pseudouridine-5'-phosphate glycosidase [Plakobranchus ocellatus]|uniref:Pseudouridine-5'-phosphate glycosidase n=1 Tax=Plakobranchus ocellatus TaxID=259542 RepID=A0AAV4A264_9GAST|nr:pseudouridine-5'-phosphate glycosidase [Plakobranchus ocellatus]
MNDTDIILRLAEKNSKLAKISRRDLASVLGQDGSGGMTVLATIFATGGIGGVHRGAETKGLNPPPALKTKTTKANQTYYAFLMADFDVSADLTERGRTPVAAVSYGVKSILDIPKTLEYLPPCSATKRHTYYRRSTSRKQWRLLQSLLATLANGAQL